MLFCDLYRGHGNFVQVKTGDTRALYATLSFSIVGMINFGGYLSEDIGRSLERPMYKAWRAGNHPLQACPVTLKDIVVCN